MTRVSLSPNLAAKFLADLDGQTVRLVLGAAHLRQAAAKQTIMTAGEKATELFLINRGRVKYYRPTKSGDEVLLGWLVPGDVFGLGTLLKAPPPYIGSAETLSESEVFVWGAVGIRRLAQAHPQLAENSLRVVLSYLKAYSERHIRAVTETAEQRLAEVLLDLAARVGEVTSIGVEVDATNEELGGLAQISPFTTSHLISRWRRKGLVTKRRHKVCLHTPEALVRVCEPCARYERMALAPADTE